MNIDEFQKYAPEPVYRIAAAMDDYNRIITPTRERVLKVLSDYELTGSNATSEFKHIPRRWEESGDGYFTFSYFMVKQFEETKHNNILNFIRSDAGKQPWQKFLDNLSQEFKEHLRLAQTLNHIRRLVRDKSEFSFSEASQFHHGLLQLYSSVKVRGAIPKVLHELLISDTTPLLYIVRTIPREKRGLPYLQVGFENKRGEIKIDEEPQPETENKYRSFFANYIVRLFTEPDFDGSSIKPSQLANNYLVFLPLFDTVFDKKGSLSFRGHFLGWIFLFVGKAEETLSKERFGQLVNTLTKYAFEIQFANQLLANELMNAWQRDMLNYTIDPELPVHLSFGKRLHVVRNVSFSLREQRQVKHLRKIYLFDPRRRELHLNLISLSTQHAKGYAENLIVLRLHQDFFLIGNSEYYLDRLVSTIRQLYQEFFNQQISLRNLDDLARAAETQRALLQDKEYLSQLSKKFQIELRTESAKELGGDFYYFGNSKDQKTVFILGDAEGHGAQAAIQMVSAHSLGAMIIPEIAHPHEFVSRFQKTLKELKIKISYLSIFCGIIDESNGELTYCNAGHPQPYLVKSRKKIIKLTNRCQCISTKLPDADYEDSTIPLSYGDTLFLFTDGFYETSKRNSTERFGILRIENWLASSKIASPKQAIDKLFKDLAAFSGEKGHRDDTTIMIIKWLGNNLKNTTNGLRQSY